MSVSVKITRNFEAVKKVVNDSIYNSFSHAAASIRSIARKSIKRRVGGEPSPVGMPPRTRRGQLKNSILYDVDKKKEDAIIGPTYSKVGLSASVHEHGGVIRGQHYDPRPFMKPALDEVIVRLPKLWQYSVK